MASFQSRFRDKIGQWFGKPLTVDAVRDVTPHFRRIRASGPWLQSASVAPGDKLQIMISESGPRTFTPFAHDAAAGTLDILAYVHGDTHTAAWIRGAAPGATFHVVGPRGSLALAALNGPVVLVGDETSFGVAAALHALRGANNGVAFVLECSRPDEARSALADLGLSEHSVVERQAGRSHLPAIERSVRAALAQHANANLVLTGHAQTIQAVRAALKAQPPSYAGQKVKAYWADGKRGLD